MSDHKSRASLQAASKAFASPFVEQKRYFQALGGSRGDLNTVLRYLALAESQRPSLTIYFDRRWYLEQNPDVATTDQDALIHFLSFGLQELRSPHPLIDMRYIDSFDPAYFAGGASAAALVELLEFGLVDPSPYFSVKHYDRQVNQDERGGYGPLAHFLTVGLQKGVRPHSLLDPYWYAGNYPDVPRDPYQALSHFVSIGDAEGRSSCPAFNGERYLKRYPDVANAGVPALAHFIAHGRSEARQATMETRVALADGAPMSTYIDNKPYSYQVSPEDYRSIYRKLRSDVALFKAMNIENLRPEIPPIEKIGDDPEFSFEMCLIRLKLPYAPKPKVSVIIPVFNEIVYTMECLISLCKYTFDIDYEVIIADDASTETMVERLAEVPNIIVVRQDRNLGFLRNCNEAAKIARGEYVLLLNNDTQILGPVLRSLASCLDSDPTIGAAGPKIIYPNGRLQEAGCSLDSNGLAQMNGLFGDPADPRWSFARDVHYISGAALMIRHTLLAEGLFDLQFAPAYCEDTDLCLRLWSKGKRVRYCPEAVVAHHLSVSTGKTSTSRRLQLVCQNQAKLAKKWAKLLSKMNEVRTIAFYLPQFHPIAENDRWWGAGFTEWTNTTRAQPSYQGHYQPHLPADLGFYDLRLTDVFVQQAKLALRYGVTGFCVYYYNFDGRRVLEGAFENMISKPEVKFPFCICWANENWTRHWDGGDAQVLLGQTYSADAYDSVIDDAVRYAKDPRYILVHGLPMFLLYRPALLPDAREFAKRCRLRFKQAGFLGVHLVYVESMELASKALTPSDIGFDAAVEFPPQGLAVANTESSGLLKQGWSGFRYDYEATAKAFINRPTVSYTRYPAVFPSWDNTPRQSVRGTSFDGANPAAFQGYVESKLEEVQESLVGDNRLLFVNAWNEWAEGAHLEPDQAFGHSWLEALSNGLFNKGAI